MKLEKILRPFKEAFDDDEELYDESDEWDEDYKEEEERLKSIRFGEKSLLVFYDKRYQMIDCGDSFLFVRIRSFESSPLVTDFDNIPDEVMNSRKNIVIQKKDITSVTVVMGEDSEFWDEFSEEADISTVNDIDFCFGFSIECEIKDPRSRDGGTKKICYDFHSYEPVEEEPLHAFFDGVQNVAFTTYDDYKKSLEPQVSGHDRKIISRLRTVITYASIISLAAGVLTQWIGQYTWSVTLRSICLAVMFLIFGLYFVFRKYFTFDTHRTQRLITVSNASYLNIISPMVFSLGGVLLAWDSMNAEIIQFGKNMVFALIITAILSLLFVCVTARQKEKIRYYVFFIFLAFAVSLCSVGLINCTYDFSEPTVYKCMITETDTENQSVTVINADGEETVFHLYGEEMYRADRGDDVTVTEHRGTLGIKWAEIDVRFV